MLARAEGGLAAAASDAVAFSRFNTRFTRASLCAALTQSGFINCYAEEALGRRGSGLG
jgi:hypothetical protein